MSQAGDVFEIVYPFVRDKWSDVDVDEHGAHDIERDTWKPGVRHEQLPPEGDTCSYADGLGKQVLTVVSTHKPGRFPLRVFYTRQWIDPDGKAFGKGACRVVVASAFATLVSGYRHEYRLKGCSCEGCKWPFHDHRKGAALEAEREAVAS